MRAFPIAAAVLTFFALLLAACKRPQVAATVVPAAPAANSASAAVPAPAPVPAKNIIRFTGEVRRGERYIRSVAPNMIFRLEPDAGNDSGWTIRMIPGTDPKDLPIDCIGAVSEPAHNDRNLYIDPPDSAGESVTPAWQQHEFEFVPDAENCKVAWALMNSVYYASKLTDEQRAEAGEKLGKIPTAHGKLTIVDSRLAPSPRAGDPPIIEWLKYDVELDMPRSQPEAGPTADEN